MQNRIRRYYEMFLKVDSFMTANADDFSGISFVAATVALLKTETAKIAALSAEKVQNTGAAKDSTLLRHDARRHLHAALEEIARVWRAAAPENGDAKNKFPMPRSTSDQNLVATAKTFAVEAEANKQFFLDRGFSPDFVTQFQDKIVAFETAINSSEDARRERVGVNASFEEPQRIATNAVRNLDPIVRRVYAANAQKLAQWEVASHVERHHGKPHIPPVPPIPVI
jgi:hypothetical protein